VDGRISCRDGGNTFTPERYRLELNSANTWAPRPTHSCWSFLFEKTKLRARQKLPAFRQRQAHNAVRHAARSRLARSVPGHRARTRASSRNERNGLRCVIGYARRMGQPTQRATNYTAGSNIEARPNLSSRQRPKHARKAALATFAGAPGATHRARLRGLTAQHISHSHSGIDEKRPMEKFVNLVPTVHLSLSLCI